MRHAELKRLIHEGAEQLNFPHEQIDTTAEDRTFSLGGKTLHYAGSAQVHLGMGGGITMYLKHLTPETVKEVLAHEVGHIRFAGFLRDMEYEKKDALRAYANYPADNDNPVMNIAGQLTPKAAQRWPRYAAWEKIHSELFGGPRSKGVPDEFQGMRMLAATGGITAYAHDWWEAWHRGEATTDQAMHETIAEMAALEFKRGAPALHTAFEGKWAGKLPKHKKTKAYPEGFAHTKAMEKIQKAGAEAWRDLYRLVNKHTAQMSQTQYHEMMQRSHEAAT
jgi:hypothetical protein